MCKSFTSLVRFIPKYFSLFDAVVNGWILNGYCQVKEATLKGYRGMIPFQERQNYRHDKNQWFLGVCGEGVSWRGKAQGISPRLFQKHQQNRSALLLSIFCCIVLFLKHGSSFFTISGKSWSWPHLEFISTKHMKIQISVCLLHMSISYDPM